MKIADFREAAMEWTMTIEGRDEYGEVHRAQLRIEKGFDRSVCVGMSLQPRARIAHTPDIQRQPVRQPAPMPIYLRWETGTG
jgi:hypothetical protein